METQGSYSHFMVFIFAVPYFIYSTAIVASLFYVISLKKKQQSMLDSVLLFNEQLPECFIKPCDFREEAFIDDMPVF